MSVMPVEQSALSRQRAHEPRPVAGVVLAAGSSSRMGRNKLLFDVGGEPLVRRTVRAALAAGLDPILVVLGHEADAIRAALTSLPCRFVTNARFTEGMNSSVCAGIAALPAEVGAAVVLLADMPFIVTEMIATIMAQYRSGDASLILSEYEGVIAPPTLVDRSLFAELASEAGKGCGRRLRRRHPELASTVSWPATALADLDVPEDYERVKARLATT
ncbi:MAG TPA: nucleotidyltransferase family protein [Casimicrobiaceae bacterium]|nr:nucleotidyltransferase family protein [Casimicrobiaceae bacterium]